VTLKKLQPSFLPCVQGRVDLVAGLEGGKSVNPENRYREKNETQAVAASGWVMRR